MNILGVQFLIYSFSILSLGKSKISKISEITYGQTNKRLISLNMILILEENNNKEVEGLEATILYDLFLLSPLNIIFIKDLII